MPKQYGFYFDSSACSGCKACQIACKDKHDLNVGLLWRRVYEITGGEWKEDGNTWVPDIAAYHLSISCNHCENPVCSDVCPTHAIYKRPDGIVLIDHGKCMGCRYCEWACPYSALQFDEAFGTMSKCHFCYDLIDRGEGPACVTACPMRALDFGDISRLRKDYSGTGKVYPLPDESLTKPALLIKPHKDSEKAEKVKAVVSNGVEVGRARK